MCTGQGVDELASSYVIIKDIEATRKHAYDFRSNYTSIMKLVPMLSSLRSMLVLPYLHLCRFGAMGTRNQASCVRNGTLCSHNPLLSWIDIQGFLILGFLSKVDKLNLRIL